MLKQISTALMVLLCVVHHDVAAQKQYAYDVKTPLAAKYELQIVKQGVLLALDDSPTAHVQEFGEDYSLWLTEVQRFLRGDSLHVIAQIELRGPSALGRGELFARRNCHIQYHWERANTYARDHFDSGQFTHQSDYTQTAQNIGSMMSLSGSPYGNPIGVLSGAMVAGAIVGLGEALSKDPSPLEVMESIYIGQSVLHTVETLVQTHPR